MPSINQLDHYNKFMQDGMRPGKFASAEFMAIAMGPPALTDLTAASVTPSQLVFPMGIVQNFNLSQNMAVARIFEIGSKRSYMFPGKVVGMATFGRPYYHGKSLLRLVMAYYKSEDMGGGTIESAFVNGYTGMHKVHTPPGYDNLFINLASDIFSQPHGQLIIVKDTDNVIIGAFYLEQCYIPGHNWAVDAQGIIFQEGVQIQYERLMPVDISTAYPFQQEDWRNPTSTQTFLQSLNSTFGAALAEGGTGDSDARTGNPGAPLNV